MYARPPQERPARRRSPVSIRNDPDPGLLRALLYSLYDLAWVVLALLGAPWLLWSSVRHRGFGAMVVQRLGRGLADIPPRTKPRVLVHGVSVGEIKAARSLVQLLEGARPGVEVVLCATTNTGLEMARKLFPGHRSVRFPADISFLTARFLRAVDPELVVLVELEVWPNFLRSCNRQGRPVAVVNGRITRESHGRYLFGRRLLPEFNRISLFCVQSPEYARRFGMLGVDPARIVVTGNVKADGLRIGAVEPGEELRRLAGGGPGQQVLVAGSTHEPEELLVARAARAAAPGCRLVLVPRHPVRAPEIVESLRQAGFRLQRLSALRAGERVDHEQPLLVDTIGELERVYALADLVFVGGSLIPHGGQNMLEPAAQGRPVLFGPHVENFEQEAALLLSAGASRQVADEFELERELRALLGDGARRASMGRAGMEAVSAQRGATRLTLDALRALELGALASDAGPG
jgi:3-deoxy-D-manno-octulosonic-acid transferase